jgi:hypothetical protein
MISDTDLPAQPHTVQQQSLRYFKLLKPLALLATVFLIALMAGTGGYLLGMRNTQSTPPSQPSPSPQLTMTTLPLPTIAQPLLSNPLPLNRRWVKDGDLLEVLETDSKGPDWRYSGSKIRYTSPSLGVSFTYFTDYPGDINIFVQRKGNEICLKPKSRDHCLGSLKVFKKKPTQSLKDAITDQFLAGYDTKKCYVDDIDAAKARMLLKKTRLQSARFARILYSPAETEIGPQYAFKYCPPEIEVHDLRYFIADESSAPDKYAFTYSGHDGPEFLDLEFLPNSLRQ